MVLYCKKLVQTTLILQNKKNFVTVLSSTYSNIRIKLADFRVQTCILCIISILKALFYLFIYLYIYPPDSQESDGGVNT